MFNLKKARKAPGLISKALVSKTMSPILSTYCNPNVFNSLDSFSFDLWHKRLRHSSTKIVTKTHNECNIQFKANKMPPLFCVSCQMGKRHKLPFQTLR